MSLLVIGLSHHYSPVSLREQFAVAESQLPEAMADLRAQVDVEELVMLSTCNRVELYAAHDTPVAALATNLKRRFAANRNFKGALGNEIYVFAGRASLRHLFRVASGLDSEMIGETEILGQLKRAYQIALQHRHTGRQLNKAFQKAFQVGKQCRSETSIQQGAMSVPGAAVKLAEKIFDGLQSRQVMVLGAGDTSEKTARDLRSRGADSIIVSNRSHGKAQSLAQELGGQSRAVRFEEWATAFSQIDIIISSTAAPHCLLNRSQLANLLKNRPARPLLLIDIAVPRDIDPGVEALPNVYLYNIDDLQDIVKEDSRRRQKEIARCETIIAKRVDEVWSASLSRPQAPEQKPAFGSEAPRG